MTFKHFFIHFSQLHEDYDLRTDVKYHSFVNDFNWNPFKSKVDSLISLKEVLFEDVKKFYYQDDEEYRGIPTGQSYIDEDGDIRDFQVVSKDNHPNRLCRSIDSENVLISSLRLAKSPALSFENEDLSKFVFSNGFYSLRVNDGWNKKFMLHLLRSKKIKRILDEHLYRGIGISSYKLMDLQKIKIPNITEAKQNQVVLKIEPIEEQIQKYKKQIKHPQEIFDSVFANEFGFNMERFFELNRVSNYMIAVSKYANNRDLRCGVNFHNESAYFVFEELKKVTNFRLKDFITTPIVLGASISPSDFCENGDYFYISMESIKNFAIELDISQIVSSEYASKNSAKSIKKSDILMTRSGAAIGKFALVEQDIKGIFADFTMRIRLTNYNPHFAYYYFRTTYFQHLVHSWKKGLQNKNIFPSQIQELPMIGISIKEQRRIVNEIKTMFDEQKDIKRKIASERLRIDKIILAALRSST